MRLQAVVVLLVLAGTVFSPAAGAQENYSEDFAARGNYLTVKVAVLGPGDELYVWWGHIGLIIEDALSGQSRFYDWGVFSFDTENFYYDFAFGRLIYSCIVSPAEKNIARNVRENRDITVYTLDLPPEKRTELFLFAENNVLPENKDYAYHHFKDNCATRVRDMIDLASDGAFGKAYRDAPGRFTLRQHVRRHTWFSPFFDWALSFWMGQDIDTPITVWEEMFLPSEIGMRIANFSWTDSSGINHKLVSQVEVLNRAVNRPAVLDVPRKQWPRELAAGILIAALVLLFRIKAGACGAKQAGLWRAFSGVSQAALGLFFGVVGFLLFFMAFFTNHDYTYHNSNLLFVNPLLFTAVPFGLRYAFTRNEIKRRRARTVLAVLWTYVFFAGVLTMAIKLLPWFWQQNQATQALVLPFALALSFFPDLIRKLILKPAQ